MGRMFKANPPLWTHICYNPDNLTILFPLTQAMYLDQLLACVDVLLRQCESDCGSVSLQLLQVLVTVQSLATEPHLSNKVRKQKHKDAMPDSSAALPSLCSTWANQHFTAPV